MDFKNLISDKNSITLIAGANYRSADFTNATNVTIMSSADICGATFDNHNPYEATLDNHDSTVKSITSPELIVKLIKNNFRGDLAEFKLWIKTINSIDSFDLEYLDDSLNFENYNYNEVKVKIELLAALFEIAMKNQTAFRVQDYEEEFNLMLQIIKHPEQYKFSKQMISFISGHLDDLKFKCEGLKIYKILSLQKLQTDGVKLDDEQNKLLDSLLVDYPEYVIAHSRELISPLEAESLYPIESHDWHILSGIKITNEFIGISDLVEINKSINYKTKWYSYNSDTDDLNRFSFSDDSDVAGIVQWDELIDESEDWSVEN